MNILILSQFMTPEPQLKGMEFAKKLSESGHNVEVLTGFPNYPGGKIYNGYKLKKYQSEIVDGIRINRVWLYPSHDQSSVKRILNYLSFAISSSLFVLIKKITADVVYVYHPPATLTFPALILKLFKRKKIVYDIQDLWPDTLKSTGMLTNEFVLSIIGIYLRFCYKIFDKIVVLSEGFKFELIKRGVTQNKIEVIHNWSLEFVPEKEEFINPFSDLRESKIILFAGTMGKAQALEKILIAAEVCQTEQMDYHFAFVGGGIEVDRLKEIKKIKELGNVTFFPRVTANEVHDYLSRADLLLVHLKNDPLFEITIPSKIQAYLKAGKPILCGVKGDSSKLITVSNSGYCFEPEDPVSLVGCLKKISSLDNDSLKQIGLNGKKYYEEFLDLRVGVRHFERIFTGLIV